MEINVKKCKKSVFFNKNRDFLEKIILKNEKSKKLENGAIAVYTGERTSRSASDRYIVCDDFTVNSVDWNEYNKKMSPIMFEQIFEIVNNYSMNSDLYVFDGIAGMDSKDIFKVRIISELASQAYFADNMFKNADDFGDNFDFDFTILSLPNLRLDSKKFNLNSDVAIILNLTEKIVLVVGSGYSCEIKKAIFSIFNYIAPKAGILGMHCSCNCDTKGQNPALFFGLSGTGKTTLSSDSSRLLVGDDQHGWNEKGVYNIENGSYAKIYNLSPESDAMIFNAIKTDALIENVLIKNGVPDYADKSITENMRSVIPMSNFSNIVESGECEHPTTIFFLSADAYGVLPPISKLTASQIKKFFLCGYTSKLAGTENDIKSPQPTFSCGFGAPFLPLNSQVYANMLLKKIQQHNCKVFLINTGWLGDFNDGQKRVSLKLTRSLVTLALNGAFDNCEYITQPYISLLIPQNITSVKNSDLNPISHWTNTEKYTEILQKLNSEINIQYSKINNTD